MRVISLYRSPSIYSAVMNGRAEQIALWGRGRFLFCFVFSIFDVRLVLEFHLLVRFVVSSSHHHHTYIVCVVVFSHFATTQHLVVMYSFSALCGILICVLAPLLYLMSSPTSFKSYILRRRLPIELVFRLPSWPGFHAIFNCHHLRLRITPSASCALQVANVNICKASVFHSEAFIISNVDIAARRNVKYKVST